MVYANPPGDNPLDHGHGLAEPAHNMAAVDLLLRLVWRDTSESGLPLWRGSLLPLGREAAPSEL